MRARRVLVVDDDADVREALSDVLEQEGYAVECAGDGFEALARLRAGAPPSLILLDWMMPRCDGPQLSRRLREDPALAQIDVVLLTADARVHDKMGEVAAREYLTKPVALERLLEVVARYCPR